MEDDEPTVVWPAAPLEDDGTDPELTSYSGQPRRALSALNHYEWLQSSPWAQMLNDLFTLYEGVMRISDEVLALINTLPDDYEDDVDRDRARWFKYWARRTRERFGDEAGIEMRW
jgi:hypothetical protein